MSRTLFFGICLGAPLPLWATSSSLPGATIGLEWALPFGVMLLCIALLPLCVPQIWKAHYGKISVGLAGGTIASLCLTFGASLAGHVFLDTLLQEYLPFIIMIGALYTIAGGIQLHIEAPPTPLINTIFLACGTFLAGWIGTTGASMLLIRPFLLINNRRKNKVHHAVFFIFLVANMGGALTPLGDPPLFLGFLKGVDFFWPLTHLSSALAVMVLSLLGIFYGVDFLLAKREGFSSVKRQFKIRIKGAFNIILFGAVLGLILLSGVWGPSENIPLLRDGGLLLLAALSYHLTPATIHKANHFSWEPFQEVAKLFFGIFVTVIPVIAILQAGAQGALAPLITIVTHNGCPQNNMYFWLSGGLSSFLDNAPTYLVFFHMAGGDAEQLMTTLSGTLAAISLGSVFMGAMTYIGNAPNFMIKTIAESQKVHMPTFFGYMMWSGSILLPLLLLLSWWKF